MVKTKRKAKLKKTIQTIRVRDVNETTVGIDPGLSGGLAIIKNKQVVMCAPMPKCDDGIDARVLFQILGLYPEATAFLELVHAMPGQGVTSMFSFGKGFGRIQGVLAALNMPTVLVPPQTWKKAVLSSDYAHDDKRGTIAFIQKIYPDAEIIPGRCRVPHDGICDAIAIAHYGIGKR
jgi:crossover junction endodeoxyribonuclease RuvC